MLRSPGIMSRAILWWRRRLLPLRRVLPKANVVNGRVVAAANAVIWIGPQPGLYKEKGDAEWRAVVSDVAPVEVDITTTGATLAACAIGRTVDWL